MERGKITISENGVKITPANGNVWLSEWQIAKLFDVFPVKVSSNIKRIYGVTFIDYQNRTVLSGSRLGKEFSANVFNELFNSPNQPEQTHQHTNPDSSLGSAFWLFDIPQSGNDYEEENFVREHRKKKPQKKRGWGI